MADQTMRTGEPRGWGNMALWIILGVVALLLIVWLIWGMWGGDEAEVGVAGTTIEEVVENPAAYRGQVVTLRGEVGEVMGAGVFTLEEPNEVFDQQVLVVSRADRAVPVEVDQSLVVRGEVRIFELAGMERDLGYDLADETYYGWEGKPVIMASEVERLPAAGGTGY